MSRLPDSCRSLIDLHAVQGKTYAEIAALLGKTEGSLRTQMHRCVARAQRVLSEVLLARTEKNGSTL